MNQIYAWGQGLKDNAFGRSAILWKPTALSEFDGDVAGLCACESRILVWDTSGSLFSWYQTNGKTGSRAWEQEPTLPDGYGVLDASCSDNHVVAVDESGKVYSWGQNAFGEVATSQSLQSKPIRIDARNQGVAAVCAGVDMTAVVTDRGDTMLQGRQQGFRLLLTTGRAARTGNQGSPNQLVQLCKRTLSQCSVQQISCGGSHTAAVTRTGQLLTWGHDRYGQLGHGQLPNQAEELLEGRGTPVTVVRYFDHTAVGSVACGEAHTLAVGKDGALYAWGWNSYGQLGVNNTANRQIPKKVPTCEPIRSVSAGFAHSMAVTLTHKILSWGWGQFGQLGHGRAVNGSTPTQIPELPGVSEVLQVCCGRDFSVAMVVGSYASPSLERTKPYEDAAEGSEISLLRRLEELKMQLTTKSELTHSSEDQIESMRAELDSISLRQRVIVAEVEELELDTAAIKTFVEHDDWSFERHERELKVVLGAHEQEYMEESETLRKMCVMLEEQEEQPLALSSSQLHDEIKDLEKELEWEGKEQARLYELTELRKIETKMQLEQEVLNLRKKAEEELQGMKDNKTGELLKELTERKKSMEEHSEALVKATAEALEVQASNRETNQVLTDESAERKLEHDRVAVQWQEELEKTQKVLLCNGTTAAQIHAGKANAHELTEKLFSDSRQAQKDSFSLATVLCEHVVVAEVRIQDSSLAQWEENRQSITEGFVGDMSTALEVDEAGIHIVGVSQGSLIIKFAVKGDEAMKDIIREHVQDENSLLFEGQVTHSIDPSYLKFYEPSPDEILAAISQQVRGTDLEDSGASPQSSPRTRGWFTDKHAAKPAAPAGVAIGTLSSSQAKDGWFAGDAAEGKPTTDGAAPGEEGNWFKGEPAAAAGSAGGATEGEAGNWFAGKQEPGTEAVEGEDTPVETAETEEAAIEGKSDEAADTAEEPAAEAEEVVQEAAEDGTAAEGEDQPTEAVADTAEPAEGEAAEAGVEVAVTAAGEAASTVEAVPVKKKTPAWFGGEESKLEKALEDISDEIAAVIREFDELGVDAEQDRDMWLDSWDFMATEEFGDGLEEEFTKAAGDRSELSFKEFFPMFHAKMTELGQAIEEEVAGATFEAVREDESGAGVNVDEFVNCCYLLVSHLKLKAGTARLDQFKKDVKVREVAAKSKLRSVSPTSRWGGAAKSTFAKVRCAAMASQFSSRAGAAARDKFAENVSRLSSTPERQRQHAAAAAEP